MFDHQILGLLEQFIEDSYCSDPCVINYNIRGYEVTLKTKDDDGWYRTFFGKGKSMTDAIKSALSETKQGY